MMKLGRKWRQPAFKLEGTLKVSTLKKQGEINLEGASSPLPPWFCPVVKGVGEEAGCGANTPIVMLLASHILGDPTPLDARQLYRPVSSLAMALNSCTRDSEEQQSVTVVRKTRFCFFLVSLSETQTFLSNQRAQTTQQKPLYPLHIILQGDILTRTPVCGSIA